MAILYSTLLHYAAQCYTVALRNARLCNTVLCYTVQILDYTPCYAARYASASLPGESAPLHNVMLYMLVTHVSAPPGSVRLPPAVLM